ncbi:MAG: FkbM family methyltransferase [Candidatus Portnoybacteria bacterium]
MNMKRLKLNLFKVLKKIYSFLIGTGIHRKLPFMAPIYDFLFRYFWPYPEIIEIQGSKMYINVREKDPEMRKTFRTYAFDRIHEESTTNLFKKTIKKGDVVVDLGANIGYFTLLAAKLAGKEGKVYSFEPEPRNYNYLLKNIGLNGYKNILAMQKAVSDRNGTTKLYVCPYDTGHHTINQQEGIEDYRHGRQGEVTAIDIETVALDDFLKDKENSVNVMKIDVEGAEMLALSGMDRILKENKDIKIFVEFFPLLIRKMGSSPEEFIRRLLEDYHFSIFIIGSEYSMGNSERDYLKINNSEEIMNFCKGEQDHLNLFLERTNAHGSVIENIKNLN